MKFIIKKKQVDCKFRVQTRIGECVGCKSICEECERLVVDDCDDCRVDDEIIYDSDDEICPRCGDEWTETTRCDCPNDSDNDEDGDEFWEAKYAELKTENDRLEADSARLEAEIVVVEAERLVVDGPIYSKYQDDYITKKFGVEYDWILQKQSWTTFFHNVIFSDGENTITGVWVGLKNDRDD